MAYDLRIIKTSDFIRFDGKGAVEVEKSHNLLRQLAKTCVDRSIECVLLDLRQVQGSLPLAEVYRLAMAFTEMGFTKKQRLAVLHRLEGLQRAELFAMLATSKGWNVRAFDDYEEAIEWFSDNETVPAN